VLQLSKTYNYKDKKEMQKREQKIKVYGSACIMGAIIIVMKILEGL
jgi:hypothetical protein